MRLLLATILALCNTYVQADITIAIPLYAQLPQIAHVGTPYSWTLEQNTFTYVDSNGTTVATSFSYAATGLPTWAQFDADTLTFSGTPNTTDRGSVQVDVTANLTDSSLALDGDSTVSTSFTLLTLEEVAPTLSIPISGQLITSSSNSLGAKNVLPGNILHIPLGWSFSMGFDGDTFTQADDNDVYMSASFNGTTILPSWVTWSADTYTLNGIAPDYAGSSGLLYDVVMTGSNKPGFGGATDSFQLLVSAHALSLASSLRSVNASVGDLFKYRIPTTGLDLDGSQNDNSSNPVTVSVDLTLLSWITYDNDTATISGTPPYDMYQNATTTQVAIVPVIFSDSYNNHLPANLTINVAPFGFTAQNLPNVIVAPGEKVDISLSQYIRNDDSSVSLSATNTSSNNATNGQDIQVQFDPSNATSWLTFNSASLSLTGTMPSDVYTRVKVEMQSTNANDQTSTASFYLASSASNTTTSGGTSSHGSGSSGLSHHAKVALAVSLGCVGGLICLIALMICCRRHIAKEEHDHHGYINDDGDDQTLTDASSAKRFKKAIVIRKGQEAFTPNSVAASPYFDQEKQAGSSKPAFQSVVVVDPNGEKRDVTHEVDEPMQSRLMSNLFGGKKRGVAKNDTSMDQNAGLGLGMQDPYSGSNPALYSNQSQNQVGNSQSQQSMRTHRSSWESDLFYEDARANPTTSLSTAEHAEEAPRRRGVNVRNTTSNVNNGLNVRHRNTHINESPAFHAQGIFTPPAEEEEDDYTSETYEDSRTGLTPGLVPGSGLEEAMIMEAKVMQVRRHSPMMHSNNNPFSQATGRSAEEQRYSGAFDDAEGEDVDILHHEMPIRRQDARNRTSTLSTMTDNSQMQVMRTHYANEASAAPALSRQQDVFSPNPSFMDGASVSDYEPQETMRAILPRPRTPPYNYTRSTQSPAKTARPRSAIASSSRFMPCPCVPAIVNYPVRFHIYPTVPPPMAGAPGSPGKRSGEGMRYLLIVDDSRPHLSPYRMTWPDMLADWLTFNDATFEAFGIVPDNAGLEDLGDVEIALISIKRTARIPPSPQHGSPGKKHKRTSTMSIDSSHTVLTEEDVTVVARAKLVFQPGPQAF